MVSKLVAAKGLKYDQRLMLTSFARQLVKANATRCLMIAKAALWPVRSTALT